MNTPLKLDFYKPKIKFFCFVEFESKKKIFENLSSLCTYRPSFFLKKKSCNIVSKLENLLDFQFNSKFTYNEFLS